MDGNELRKFVLDVLTLRHEHPVRDRYNEMHFPADVNKLVRDIREQETVGEKFCENEASAKWYSKNVSKIPKVSVSKVQNYQKAKDLLSVPTDKRCSF